MLSASLRLAPKCDRTQPYGQLIYTMAAVLDPGYNFIWLDRDHPASPEVKQELKTWITCECL